jgi:uncharacterized protein (TIGR02145 family)
MCGTQSYNDTTHFCSDEIIYPKCGGQTYNPATQICGGSGPTAKLAALTITQPSAGGGTIMALIPSDTVTTKDSIPVGITVTLIATPSVGYEFVSWSVTGTVVANNAFTMPGNAVTVTANFVQTYAVTVSSASSGASGSGNYAKGDTVTISAGYPPANQRFKEWTTLSSGVEFANVDSSTTTFTMPEGAVTVTANFETVYWVRVLGGLGATGAGYYVPGATVTISAGTPPTGQQFEFWRSDNGLVYSSSATTTFRMPYSAVSVVANFKVTTINITYDTLIDKRNGTTKKYKTVKIGSQIWMAENLDHKTDSSWCFRDAESNCVKYGRLYNWAAAMNLPSFYNSSPSSSQIQTPHHQGVCPVGWHLPTNGEWETLINYVGGSSLAGIQLKATSWSGYDNYGFSALPGGYRSANGTGFGDPDGNWWTATEYEGGSFAYHMNMVDFPIVVNWRGPYFYTGLSQDKLWGYSVRCMRD